MYRLAMSAFNWTKVELKHIPKKWGTFSMAAFNWTKVELKPTKVKSYLMFEIAFNWTKVELKPFIDFPEPTCIYYF